MSQAEILEFCSRFLDKKKVSIAVNKINQMLIGLVCASLHKRLVEGFTRDVRKKSIKLD